jgi:carbonic anhydrase
MLPCAIQRRTGVGRSNSRKVVPAPERLEPRSLLSRSHVAMGLALARLDRDAGYRQAEDVHPKVTAEIGTISGRVANSVTGRGLGRVQVQLINSNGFVARRTLTGPRGRYGFTVGTNGAYVVREVTPRRWTQTSPTFIYKSPTGSYVSGYSSRSWSYNTGNTDPANGTVGVYGWGAVAPAGNLPFQSPINITVPPIDLSRYLSLNLPSTTGNVGVTAHDLRVQFSGSSQTINLGGTIFTLSGLHFHDPSEDQVDGTGYPMEEHLVFKSPAGAFAVVAVFIQLGVTDNAALQPILNAASSGGGTRTPAPIDFSGLLPASLQGWFYRGSLTVPPLSQAINWLVLSTPITLSFPQFQQYEAIARGAGFLPNARPTQPLDGRQVNQFNYDVNFENQSVAGLNFGLARRV